MSRRLLQSLRRPPSLKILKILTNLLWEFVNVRAQPLTFEKYDITHRDDLGANRTEITSPLYFAYGTVWCIERNRASYRRFYSTLVLRITHATVFSTIPSVKINMNLEMTAPQLKLS